MNTRPSLSQGVSDLDEIGSRCSLPHARDNDELELKERDQALKGLYTKQTSPLVPGVLAAILLISSHSVH